MVMFEPLPADTMFEHEPSGVVKCGECWMKDIQQTAQGELKGDEAVLGKDIIVIDNSEPIQCEGCNKQNEAYDQLGADE